MLLALVLIFLPIFVPSFKNYWWVFLGIGLFVFWIAKELFEPLSDSIRNFRYGKKGEEEVSGILKDTLDDNYVYIENYTIPNTRIGDIDGLLIGPKGVIIIEVKSYAGVFRISGEDMFRKLKRDIYKLYRKSPFKQVIRQRKYLTKFLKEKGIDVQVIAIVVLVRSKINTISGETKVFVTEPNKLTNHIFKLSQTPQWTTDLSNKLIQTLGLNSR